MDLDAVRLFISVAAHSSFSRAASDHGLHRSAVSRRVAALEQALGVDLLIRTTRSVEPTTAGRRLLEEVGPLLERVERAVAQLPEAADVPAGPLHVSAPRDVGTWILPTVLGELADAHPAITPSVELSNRLVDVEGEGFDVALRVSRTRLSGSGLRVRRIGTLRVRVYAAPCYVARHDAPQSLRDLANHPLVGLPEVVPEGVHALQAMVSAGDMLLAAELATHGAGVAFLPSFVAEGDVASGRLVRLLPDEEVAVAGLYLVFPDVSRLPLKTIAFRDRVLRFMEDHPLN
ncbi:MAG: LysR family transcriptional regulator [Myxococcota bacterium]